MSYIQQRCLDRNTACMYISSWYMLRLQCAREALWLWRLKLIKKRSRNSIVFLFLRRFSFETLHDILNDLLNKCNITKRLRGFDSAVLASGSCFTTVFKSLWKLQKRSEATGAARGQKMCDDTINHALMSAENYSFRHYIVLAVPLSQRWKTLRLLKVAGILWFIALQVIIWSLKHTFILRLTCLGWETRPSSRKVKVTYFHCRKPSAVRLHHCSISSDCSLLCSLTTSCFWVYVYGNKHQLKKG